MEPIKKCSETGIKLSLTIATCQAVEIGSDALSSKGTAHKAIKSIVISLNAAVTNSVTCSLRTRCDKLIE
jgi:hypothetical protein